jgi:hypothetical protein
MYITLRKRSLPSYVHALLKRCNAHTHIGFAVNLHKAGSALSNGAVKTPGMPVPEAVAQMPYSIIMKSRNYGLILKSGHLFTLKIKGYLFFMF